MNLHDEVRRIVLAGGTEDDVAEEFADAIFCGQVGFRELLNVYAEVLQEVYNEWP